MKNIRFLIILSLLIPTSVLVAQKTIEIKGEKYYDSYSFSESIEKFESITNKTVEIKRKLADSYFKIGMYKESEKYYKDIVSSDERQSDDLLNYAQVLRINQKYDESETWMKEYYNLEKNDSRAKLYVQNPGFYMNLLLKEGLFTVRNLDINSSSQDFGTAYYKDKIVFASTGSDMKALKKEWNWNQQPFLDLFVADMEDLDLKNVKPFKNSINKKFHEGPASFSKDGNFMAFTRNNYTGKSKDGIIKLQLFTSRFENGEWTNPKPFPYNDTEYSLGHPSLSDDGKKMYFASDMPGGIGGVDIYVSELQNNGNWSKPKNLGNTINTEGNEMFPFIHNNGFLFFSSDGLLGLGGLDVFLTKKVDNKYTTPKNVGMPVNSNYDDFAFIVNNDLTKGYFSSDRTRGEGSDDIYSFKTRKPITLDLILKGTAYDSDKNILANTEVNLFDSTGLKTKTFITDGSGKYEFEINRYTHYKLEGKNEKYISDEDSVDTHTEKLTIYQDLILEQVPDFVFICNVVDEKDSIAISNTHILFTDISEDDTNTFFTDEKGSIFLNLDGKELNDSLDYSLTFEKENYVKKTEAYKTIIDRAGEYIMNVKLKKIETGDDLGKLLSLNPIYFDLNKFDIRKDAAAELDKIVEYMNKYPKMVVELSSHTDCRGSSIYNLKLSDRRAKASANYIRSKITDPSRISGVGFGEAQLINDCGCEGKMKSDCTEEEHQENRRTEFKIIRM